MTITKKEIESAIAEVESIQGQYLVFAESTQDQQAKSMYQTMAADVTHHLQQLYNKLDQIQYSQWVNKVEPKPPRLRNAILAFTVGGFVSLIGEGVTDFYVWAMGISHQRAADPTVATMIFLGCLLTGLGWFDKLARHAGAGLAVPVTGFANAMSASALEYKREGLVFGIGGRMFQLAGAVIVYGVTTAFFVGLVSAILKAIR
ncbi:MAG: stage V sporulation protein AC [Bacillota bacterium]